MDLLLCLCRGLNALCIYQWFPALCSVEGGMEGQAAEDGKNAIP